MDKSIFRQKSIDRVSSPEQLNDYIRVCNPSIWLVLSAILVLLIGTLVWGIFGKLDTTLPLVCISNEGQGKAFVKVEDKDQILQKEIRLKEEKILIDSNMVSKEPIAVDASFSEYMLYVGALSLGEWVYEISFPTNLSDGVYEATCVVESVSPMSFILN